MIFIGIVTDFWRFQYHKTLSALAPPLASNIITEIGRAGARLGPLLAYTLFYQNYH